MSIFAMPSLSFALNVMVAKIPPGTGVEDQPIIHVILPTLLSIVPGKLKLLNMSPFSTLIASRRDALKLMSHCATYTSLALTTISTVNVSFTKTY